MTNRVEITEESIKQMNIVELREAYANIKTLQLGVIYGYGGVGNEVKEAINHQREILSNEIRRRRNMN